MSALTGDHVIVITTYINLAPSRSDFYFTFKEFHNHCFATNSNDILTYYYILGYHTASINQKNKLSLKKLKNGLGCK